MLIYWSWMVLMNLAGYISMGYDKSQAKRHRSRVSERRLFAIAFLGGGVGAYAGMRSFRHKTKHTSFRILLPLAVVVNVALYVWLFRLLQAN